MSPKIMSIRPGDPIAQELIDYALSVRIPSSSDGSFAVIGTLLHAMLGGTKR